MNKAEFRKFLYLGIILGILRIVITLIVSELNFDVGYFFDIFIFAYLFLCLLIPKRFFSLKEVTLIILFVAIIAIIVYDLFILLYRHPVSLKSFFYKRSIVALNILLIACLSSICYFFTQQFLLKKSK